jgi:hypothetical protein
MRVPSAAQPPCTDPGGFQARADGQHLEVRTFEGELIGVVPSSVADDLVRSRLADELRHGLRLKLGIRWLPPRFDRPSGRPDLKQMQRRQPERYEALWRGTLDAHSGNGALGRRTVDKTVPFGSTRKRSNRT